MNRLIPTVVGLISMAAGVTHALCPLPFVDADADLVADFLDNCRILPNGPNQIASQADTDLDGHGNRCDADFDNNLAVTAADFAAIVGACGSIQTIPCPLTVANLEYDLDGDGRLTGDPAAIVNQTPTFGDFEIFRQLFGTNLFAIFVSTGDSDADCVVNALDNCPLIPNANGKRPPGYAIGSFCDDQQDSDNDGFGNACDADYLTPQGNPIPIANGLDWNGNVFPPDPLSFTANYPSPPKLYLSEYDLNCSGTVNGTDGAIFLRNFGVVAGKCWDDPPYPANIYPTSVDNPYCY